MPSPLVPRLLAPRLPAPRLLAPPLCLAPLRTACGTGTSPPSCASTRRSAGELPGELSGVEELLEPRRLPAGERPHMHEAGDHRPAGRRAHPVSADGDHPAPGLQVFVDVHAHVRAVDLGEPAEEAGQLLVALVGAADP